MERASQTEYNEVSLGDQQREEVWNCNSVYWRGSLPSSSELMKKAETVSETLDCNAIDTRLIAREDFVKRPTGKDNAKLFNFRNITTVFLDILFE
jgi:hypothetical protein